MNPITCTIDTERVGDQLVCLYQKDEWFYVQVVNLATNKVEPWARWGDLEAARKDFNQRKGAGT